jgi:hypothetical protein
LDALVQQGHALYLRAVAELDARPGAVPGADAGATAKTFLIQGCGSPQGRPVPRCARPVPWARMLTLPPVVCPSWGRRWLRARCRGSAHRRLWPSGVGDEELRKVIVRVRLWGLDLVRRLSVVRSSVSVWISRA